MHGIQLYRQQKTAFPVCHQRFCQLAIPCNKQVTVECRSACLKTCRVLLDTYRRQSASIGNSNIEISHIVLLRNHVHNNQTQIYLRTTFHLTQVPRLHRPVHRNNVRQRTIDCRQIIKN